MGHLIVCIAINYTVINMFVIIVNERDKEEGEKSGNGLVKGGEKGGRAMRM